MDALIDWLRQVVLVLLTAAFLDWFLPTAAMQRYVKAVMGLVVVGTLLTPLMQVFHLTEGWKNAVSALSAPGPPDSTAVEDVSARVMRWEAEEVQNRWKEEVRRRIEERARAVSGREVSEVHVEQEGAAAPGRVPSPPPIRKVEIVLARSSGGPPRETILSGAAPEIRPVERVRVGRDAPSGAVSEDAGTSAEDGALFRRVAQAVAADLGIDASKVEVRFDSS